MKAIAWILAALFQTTLSKLDLLQFVQEFANSCHLISFKFIESHPSPWNWFYEAVLIGSEGGLRSQPAMQSFFTLGLYHLIVGAGGHILALEKIVEGLTFFLPKKLRNVFVGISLVVFTVINRLQASCVRALFQWTFLRKKSAKPLTRADLQIVVTCFCLILEPSWALSFSFQLSCAATLGIAIASSISINGVFLRRLTATFLCSLATTPLLFCIQPCLSWIMIPANTLAMPLFGGILMPLSFLNVFLHKLQFLTEWVLTGVFALCQFFIRFERPLLCLDERKLHLWGMFYIVGLYFCWRLFLPFFIQRRFWTGQRKWNLKSYSGT